MKSFDVESTLVAVPCNLCGVQNEEFLFHRSGSLTGYPFRVVRCRNCGFMYVNPRLSDSGIRELYRQEYYEGKGFDNSCDYMKDYAAGLDEDKKFMPENTIRMLGEFVPPPARILDYGCGMGDLMRQASKRGYQVEGFEVSEFAAQFCREQGFRVHEHERTLPVDSYDAVTCIEVLEHCFSPISAIESVSRSLKPGGLFYYSTANFDGYYDSLRRGRDSRDGYIRPEGHINFFNTEVMTAFFRKVGFTQVFPYEPRIYDKSKHVFKLLARMKLIDARKERPETLIEKGLYFGGRRLSTILLKRYGLPLARK